MFSVLIVGLIFFVDGKILWDVWNGCIYWCEGVGFVVYEGLYYFDCFFF